MPSDSPLRSFLAELSPEDITTLVGRLSRLMPQGAAVYSPELNAGEAELVAKRRAERDAARVRELEIMEQMLPQMAARRRAAVPEAQADVFVPTRPRVMRESPFMFTQPQSSRAYAGGGPVLGDHTMPDVSDSGQMFMDPTPFAGGGKVLGKNLDQMQAELMSKQGLSRRSLFGLPTQSQQYPLSKVEQEVQRLEQQARKKGEAPAVSTTRVDVDPGTGSKRSVMESLVETPVSRRAVLKTAGSQAMQSMLPVGDIAKALDVPVSATPVGAIAQATRAAPPTTLSVPAAVIAELGKLGDDYWKADYSVYAPEIARKLNVPEQQVIDIASNIESVLGTGPGSDIYDVITGFQPYMLRPSDVAKLSVGIDPNEPNAFGALRSAMRDMKTADPGMFDKFKRGVKDFTTSHNESWYDAYEVPESKARKLHEQFLRGKKSYEDVNKFWDKYSGQ